MIQQKLAVGRYLNFITPAQQAPSVPLPAAVSFLPLQQMLLNIGESTGILSKTSAVSAGVNAKAWRNFQWLQWKPGFISEVRMTPDVLTGPMSGCDLVIYRRNGFTCAGHLGTDVGAAAKNTAVKNTWNQWAQTHAGDVIAGFNPFRAVMNNIPPRTKHDQVSAPLFFGVMTSNNQLFTLILYPQTSNPNIKRIADLVRVQTMSTHALQHL